MIYCGVATRQGILKKGDRVALAFIRLPLPFCPAELGAIRVPAQLLFDRMPVQIQFKRDDAVKT